MLKLLAFIKGKNRPVLFENVAGFDIHLSGALLITFKDGSRVTIADGQWREVDIEKMVEEVIKEIPEAPEANPETIGL